ncbi:hypothetical protein [Nocardia thraciensis]
MIGLSESAPHLTFAIHLLLMFICAWTLVYWRRQDLLDELRGATIGLTVAMTVAGFQVLGYAVSQLGVGGNQVGKILGMFAASIELSGVALAVIDARIVSKRLPRTIPGFRVLAAAPLPLAIMVVFLGLFTFVLIPKPPTIITGTQPDRTDECLGKNMCDGVTYVWGFADKGSHIDVVINRGSERQWAESHSPAMFQVNDNCPAVIEWELVQNYGEVQHGTINQGSGLFGVGNFDLGILGPSAGQSLHLTARRIDDNACRGELLLAL